MCDRSGATKLPSGAVPVAIVDVTCEVVVVALKVLETKL